MLEKVQVTLGSVDNSTMLAIIHRFSAVLIYTRVNCAPFLENQGISTQPSELSTDPKKQLILGN